MILNETKQLLSFINGLHRSPKEVLAICIKDTLDKSLEHYTQILQRAQDYLASRDPVKVLNNIEREQKKEEQLEGEDDND